MSAEQDNNKITKDNIDFYLKEFAKVFKKMNGDKMPAEIIMVGGASIITNYNFRKSTGDIDAVILSSSVAKDAANAVGEKHNLPSDWLNNDFKKTDSYSPKLREHSIPYKTFSNIVHIRTITSEYLIAMKLMAGRRYKHDLSDIVGIFLEHKNKNNPINIDKVKVAFKTLYGNKNKMPKESVELLNQIENTDDYNELFNDIKKDEKNAKLILDDFSNKYPKIINRDNINSIVSQLMEKKELKTQKNNNEIIFEKKIQKKHNKSKK